MATKPVTSIDPITGGILIQWTPPFSNAESISQYKIEIYNKAGVAAEETEYCNGFTQTILSNLRCTVPMNKLRTIYNLEYPDIMKVQITAYNIYGWGPVSDVNTLGATVYDVPLAMLSPTRGPETQIASIQVLWTAL